ncbi:glycosyltransferase family 2 protein, partial [Lactobacillus delbrueckii subsp. bulgaricus]
MSPQVSVIVPVYNVEKYLQQCVESLVNQSYQNLEILLIDDGSKDNSGQMCDQFSEQ